MTGDARRVVVVNTRPEHFAGIRDLSGSVYTGSPPWSEAQLASHVHVFPEGDPKFDIELLPPEPRSR